MTTNKQAFSSVNTFLSVEDRSALASAFAYRFPQECLRALASTGLEDNLILTGLTSLSTRPKDEELKALSPGMVVISPTRDEIRQAFPVHGNSPRAAESLMQTQLHRIQHFNNLTASRGIVFVLLDPLTITEFESSLRLLSQGLAGQPLVLISSLPPADQRGGGELEKNLQLVVKLHEEGVLTTTLLLDEQSQAAGLYGFTRQEQMVAKSIASLLLLHSHDEHNPTPEQVFKRLGALSAFAGVSVGTEKISAGTSPDKRWEALRRVFPSFSPKGQGDLQEALAKAKNVTAHVLTEAYAATALSAPEAIKPFFLLISLPFRQGDKRFFELSHKMRAFLTTTYPMGTLLCVRGKGEGLTDMEPGYYLEASLFYPIAKTSLM